MPLPILYKSATVDQAIRDRTTPLASLAAEYEKSVFTRPGFSDTPQMSVLTATSLTSPAVVQAKGLGGGSQIVSWDGQDDTKFRFWPGLYSSGNGAQNDLAMYGMTKPGGTAQAAWWDQVVEFDTDAANDQLELFGYAKAAGAALKIEVNGRVVDDVMSRVKSGAGSWTFLLKFPLARSRRIRVYMPGDTGFIGVRVPTGQTVTKSPAPSQVIAAIADSWGAGSGAADDYNSGAASHDTFVARLMRLLGGPKAAYLNASIGGTGLEAGMDGASSNRYQTRVDTVLTLLASMGSIPKTLIIYGSQTDGNIDTGARLTTLLQSVTAIDRVIVIPTLLTGFPVQEAAMKAATLAAGRTYLPVGGIINGAGGSIASPTWQGARDLLVKANNDAHMSIDGHRAAAGAVFRQAMRGMLAAA